MALNISIGFSKDQNPFRAAQEAASQIKIQIQVPADSIRFVLVFFSFDFARLEALEFIRESFPNAKIIGCSTSGIILSKTIEARGIALLAISSKDVHFGIGCLENMNNRDTLNDGQEIAELAIKDFGTYHRKLSLLFCDGILKESPLLLKNLRERLGQFSPILGAESSDNFQYLKTYQCFQGQILTQSAVLGIIGGQINVGISSHHGWKPLGKPRIVDKAHKNIVIKINGKKAVSFYEDFFGHQTPALLSGRFNLVQTLYPLGLSLPEEKKYLLYNISEVLSDGSIVCQGDIPEGSEVHIMIGSKDSCKQAAQQAALEAKEALFQKAPDLVLVFESCTRQKLLGRQAFQEIQKIKEILGEKVPIFGMYSFGEFAPLKVGDQTGRSFLQHGTITVLALEHSVSGSPLQK